MKSPAISIVIPIYNAGKDLRDSLSGILNQAFTDFELIIVNDSSTDGSMFPERFPYNMNLWKRIPVRYRTGTGRSRSLLLSLFNGSIEYVSSLIVRKNPGLYEYMETSIRLYTGLLSGENIK